METLYKITNSDRTAHGGFMWPIGKWVETSGEGEMCGPGFTHWYRDPLVGVFCNPIHGDFRLTQAVMWQGQGEVKKDDGLKVGCIKAKIIKKVPIPVLTTEQIVAAAIMISLEVYKSDDYTAWANSWLNGTERTARAAVRAARAAAEAAVRAARTAAAAVWAAEAAVRAARTAAAAVRAARAAVRAARTAEAAVRATAGNIDLLKTIKKATEMFPGK